MRAITLFREAGDAASMAAATAEALRIWAPQERQRSLAEDALAMLGPGDSRDRVSLLFALDRVDEAKQMCERQGYAEILADEAHWESRGLVAEGRIDEYIAIARTGA